MYVLKLGHLATRFEKLVKLSAVNLTPFVYTVITYVQVLILFAQLQHLFTKIIPITDNVFSGISKL